MRLKAEAIFEFGHSVTPLIFDHFLRPNPSQKRPQILAWSLVQLWGTTSLCLSHLGWYIQIVNDRR